MPRRMGQQEPSWPADREGRRVLVEDEDGASLMVFEHLLSAAGYQVAACPGPGGRPDRRCALVETGYCGLASGADVIINELRLHERTNQEVLQGLQDAYPAKPIVVEVPQPRMRQHEALLRRCQVMVMPTTSNMVIRSVEEALRRAAERRHPASGR